MQTICVVGRLQTGEMLARMHTDTAHNEPKFLLQHGITLPLHEVAETNLKNGHSRRGATDGLVRAVRPEEDPESMR